jgi:hypothetical protein
MDILLDRGQVLDRFVIVKRWLTKDREPCTIIISSVRELFVLNFSNVEHHSSGVMGEIDKDDHKEKKLVEICAEIRVSKLVPKHLENPE